MYKYICIPETKAKVHIKYHPRELIQISYTANIGHPYDPCVLTLTT